MSAPDLNLQVSRTLDTMRGALAEAVTERHYELHPDLAVRYGEAGRIKCVQDANFHLSYLAQSIAAATPTLFGDYVAWAKVMLAGRGIPAGDLAENYLHVLQRSQHEIGRLWQMNQLSVAQEHYCTAATQLIMSQLYPYIFAGEKNGRTLVATCISGDLHEIGVRMVSDFLEMEGWDTFYLGANTPTSSLLIEKTEAFLATLRRQLAAFNWEINVPVGDGRPTPLHFAGGATQDGFLIVGAKSRSGVARFYEELIRVNNEQTNALRSAMKDLSLQARAQIDRDNLYYDELSHLNNELATAQRELAKKNAELGRLNEQKNQFLGIAAHDLRNPLEVILTYSQFLLDEAAEQLDPEHVEFVRTIRSSSCPLEAGRSKDRAGAQQPDR